MNKPLIYWIKVQSFQSLSERLNPINIWWKRLECFDGKKRWIIAQYRKPSLMKYMKIWLRAVLVAWICYTKNKYHLSRTSAISSLKFFMPISWFPWFCSMPCKLLLWRVLVTQSVCAPEQRCQASRGGSWPSGWASPPHASRGSLGRGEPQPRLPLASPLIQSTSLCSGI